MNVTVIPNRALSVEISAPSSKAQTHRALVAGLLSDGTTKITNPLSCDDTEATANAVSTLGAKIVRDVRTWTVQSAGSPSHPVREIHCGESGVTLRFMIPIVSLTGGKVVVKARERLMRRPLEPLAKAMGQLGVRVTLDGDLVDVEGGPPKGGTVHIRGDVSSQFISGLLFAGPLMKDGLGLELTSPLESRHYVTLTIETMKQHGIKVQSNKKMSHFEILPSQRYCPAVHRISGDYSSAAFALSAAAITNSKVLVRNLTRTKAEPDAVLVEILSQMGAEATIVEDGVLVYGGRLKATDINLRDSPDLGPVTAVLGCYAEGETRISGAARLRYKESDRLAAITSELSSLGASIIETEDGLILRGPSSLSGGIVRSHGDHRIAMALSVAALGANGNVVIEGAECVSKSYPNFFDDLRSLGVGIVG